MIPTPASDDKEDDEEDDDEDDGIKMRIVMVGMRMVVKMIDRGHGD